MLRKLARLLGVLLLLVLIGVGVAYLYFSQQYPDYAGEESLPGLTTEVQVWHDDFGVPHIEASNHLDGYRALGYVVARERFFQLDLARRLSGGRLSELFGEAAVPTDLLYRTMLPEDLIAAQTNKRFHNAPDALKAEAQAYMDGINAYIASGETPLEYTILGAEMEAFVPEDMYRIAGYMAYSFCLGGRTEPVATEVLHQLGPEYLQGLALLHEDTESFIPSYYPDPASYAGITEFSARIAAALDAAPVPKFEGSNSWVVDGSRSASGKPILCNDTHIGLGIPQVWYEAHLHTPEVEVYGNFLPGIPYCLVGHNRTMAWGVTMLENDDMDFYIEQPSTDPTKYVVDSVSYAFAVDSITISIKDRPDTTCIVRGTLRGPIVNDVMPDMGTQVPISCWWDYQRTPNHLLEAFRSMNRCAQVEQAANALSTISAPGLNITYADTSGNIAWWSVAKWQVRPEGTLSKVIQDGSTKAHDPTGYLPFRENPQAINPPWGYVYSANDQPDSVRGAFLPGYYKPANRADRIRQVLETRRDWDTEGMQTLLTDVTSPHDQVLASELQTWLGWEKDAFTQEELALLDWDGNHKVDAVAPTVYYKLMYRTLANAMGDELGEDWLERFIDTHWRSRAVPFLMRNPSSPWWDDVNTEDEESRGVILAKSYREALDELAQEWGPDPAGWTWGKAHTLQLDHPFAKASDALGGFFGVAQKPYRGGHETVNAASFLPNATGQYATRVGAQMRIIVDLADINNSISIAPVGQSGHKFSPHYSDQAEMYRTGQFRRQDMDWERIKMHPNRLILAP